MQKVLTYCAVVLGLSLFSANAGVPEISFGGYLDADVWGNMKGTYYTNSELDLGMTMKFSDNVSAHVYATVNSAYQDPAGIIPAGGGDPAARWMSMAFDGYDITYTSPYGTFTVGDLVYQYGKFNYYFYKRLSMITNETFVRGIKYSIGNDMITQDFTAGIADANSSTSDIQGSTSFKFGEKGGSLGVYYGVRNDATISFEDGGDIYAGAEYLGSVGEMLTLKFDLGYQGLSGLTLSGDRANIISILFEPTLTLGNFSAAFTGFVSLNDDTLITGFDEGTMELTTTTNAGNIFKLGDEMFFYLEPGYKFTDVISAGLPLEYHAGDMDDDDDDAIWVVPTLYVTPFENVQWWIWGQLVKPLADGADNGYGAGSEIIVTF